jgi:hypothetical protein
VSDSIGQRSMGYCCQMAPNSKQYLGYRMIIGGYSYNLLLDATSTILRLAIFCTDGNTEKNL